MAAPSSAAIVTQELTRRFAQTVAVDRLTLTVYTGEVFGLLGHNGAGKTTTVRLLNGVLDPSAGAARVLGLDPTVDGPALRQQTGVLTETPSLDARLTVRENLAIYAELYNVPNAAERVAELLEMFHLADRADEKAGGYSNSSQPVSVADDGAHLLPQCYVGRPGALGGACCRRPGPEHDGDRLQPRGHLSRGISDRRHGRPAGDDSGDRPGDGGDLLQPGGDARPGPRVVGARHRFAAVGGAYVSTRGDHRQVGVKQRVTINETINE